MTIPARRGERREISRQLFKSEGCAFGMDHAGKAKAMSESVELLREALNMLVMSDLYDTRRHLYYCLCNRLVEAIRQLTTATNLKLEG